MSNEKKRRRDAAYRKGFADGVAASNIKPLEWRRDNSAKSLGLEYLVSYYSDPLGDGKGNWIGQLMFGNYSGRHHSIEEAKASCQADYERRVRSCFESKPAPAVHVLAIELNGVAEQLADNAGAWCSCSGCHDLNEGHPTGPWSDALKCHLGMGCSECGGIGAVWDSTDYSDYGKEHAAERVTVPETSVIEPKEKPARSKFPYSWEGPRPPEAIIHRVINQYMGESDREYDVDQFRYYLANWHWHYTINQRMKAAMDATATEGSGG